MSEKIVLSASEKSKRGMGARSPAKRDTADTKMHECQNNAFALLRPKKHMNRLFLER